MLTSQSLSRELGQTNPANGPEKPFTLFLIWPQSTSSISSSVSNYAPASKPQIPWTGCALDMPRPGRSEFLVSSALPFQMKTVISSKANSNSRLNVLLTYFFLTSNHSLASSTEAYFTFCCGSSESGRSGFSLIKPRV